MLFAKSQNDTTDSPFGDVSRLTRRCPWLVLLLILGLLSASEGKSAVITGEVINENTQRFLERALVRVEGTQLQALTGRDGKYRIAGVPAGTHTVTVQYAGLDEFRRTITVTEEESLNLRFALSSEDVYTLGAFEVTSPMEGTAFAINQQKRAETARSITSIDAFIDQSTGNPGEFMRNIPGIQMDYSQNEPNRIRLRGQDPTLTSVTMDGNEIASAASSGTNRHLEIDQLSMAAISSVEVYKSPIPSMSANAIGGAVNLITKSAFEQEGRRVGLQLGVMTDSNDFFKEYNGPGHNNSGKERSLYPVGRFNFSDSFLGNRLGIVFSAGRDHTNMLGSSASTGFRIFNAPPAPTPITPENADVFRSGFSVSPNRQLRTRTDFSLNTDLRVSESLTAFLKTTFTRYHSTNRNHSVNFQTGTTLASFTPGSTLENYGTTNGQASQGTSVFDKFTNSWQINPGLKFRSGDWTVDLVGGVSKSTNHYLNFDRGNFGSLSITTGTGLGIRYIDHRRDSDHAENLEQTSGPDMYSLNSYRPNQGNLAANGQRSNHGGMVSSNVRDSSEVRWSGRLDIQRDLRTAFPIYIKGGLSYNETIRDRRQAQRRWYWVGDDGIAGTADDTTAAGAQLGRFAEPIPVSAQLPSLNLRLPEFFSQTELFEYWQANPQVLVENMAYAEEQKFTGTRKVNEQIKGYYLMGNATFDKLNVLAGVRVEETEIVGLGHRVLPNSVLPAGVHANSIEGVQARFRRQTTESSYRSDPFPYLHLRYEISDDLQVRTSYTEGIGRPNFSQVLPSLSQNDTPVGGFDGTISSTRAGLLPQRSKNYDASVEYYTRSAGEWTAAWFMRDIEDYISSSVLPMTPELLAELNLGPEFSNYRLSTSQNLGNASWTGFELSMRQQLRDWDFVPSFLRGVEIWANHTRIYEMEGTFGGGASGPKIVHLEDVVDSQYNAGIAYRSPRGTFYVHLKTNFQKQRPENHIFDTGPSNRNYRQRKDYQFWDLETSYRVTPKLRLTATARNLGKERPTFIEMGDIVVNRQQATGIQWLFMARYDL